MASDEYESVLCVKNTIHVYRIPPRPSNRGYRAADWKLDNPDWTGRLRVVAKGKNLFIKLEDKTSGELFASCPVEEYPGIAVESVMDSSRYFVLRIKDESGRSAFIGIGFEDRGDSFDLNVSLQDHFKHLKQEQEAEKTAKELQSGPKLDLSFKEGQTIKLNIATKKSGDSVPKRPKGQGLSGGGLLPPPPGGVKITPPPSGASGQIASAPVSQTSVPSQNSHSADFLLDLGMSSGAPSSGHSGPSSSEQSNIMGLSDNSDFGGNFVADSGGKQQQQLNPQPVATNDPWGDFASASSGGDSTGWVQF